MYPVKFSVFPPPSFDALLPSTGPRWGNTSIAISGSHFFSAATPTEQLTAAVASHGLDFRCRFGNDAIFRIVPATLVNDSALLCTSPARKELFDAVLLPSWEDVNLVFNNTRVEEGSMLA